MINMVDLKLTEQEASLLLTAIYTLYNSETARKAGFFEADTEDETKLKLKALSAEEAEAYADSITNITILSNLFTKVKYQLEQTSAQ